MVLLLPGTGLPLALHVLIHPVANSYWLLTGDCWDGAIGRPTPSASHEPARHPSRKPNPVIGMRLCGLHPKHARPNQQSRTVIAAGT